jgi:hypothetical protein
LGKAWDALALNSWQKASHNTRREKICSYMINTSIKGKTWVVYKNLVAYADSAFEIEAKNHNTKLRAVKKIQETAG